LDKKSERILSEENRLIEFKDQSSIIDQIRPFLEPASIAVVGAHANTGEQAFNVIEHLMWLGYTGNVIPVNPEYEEILGRKCYPSISEVPDKVDLALLQGPRSTIPGVVQQCVQKGIKSVVIAGAGFADADDEGRRLQNEIVNIARRGGIRVLGPNTIGSANPFFNFSTSFARQTEMKKWPVGVVCQSGMFFGTIGRLNLLGKGVDLGNSCDVDISDVMEYFVLDPDVKVVVLHIEGVIDCNRLKQIAGKACRKKPVIVLKTGRTAESGKAAKTHTGSLVGRDEVWDAFFRQYGMTRAETFDDLSDLVNAFCYLPLMSGRRVGIVTASGGIGIACLDACKKYNLEVAELGVHTKRKLNAMSPSWFEIANPLDIWPMMLTTKQPYGETFRDIVGEVLGDPGVDGIVLFAGAWFDRINPPITRTLVDLAKTYPGKPIAWCPYYGWLYDNQSYEIEQTLMSMGMPVVFSNPEDSLRALAALARYQEFLNDSQ